GVAHLERVERPRDPANGLSPREFTLAKLDLVAQPARLVLGHNARELRVEAEPARDPAEKGERHRDGLAASPECAQNEAPVEVGSNHGRHRNHVALLGDSPGPALSVLAGAVIGDRLGTTDRDSFAQGRARVAVRHGSTCNSSKSAARRAARSESESITICSRA